MVIVNLKEVILRRAKWRERLHVALSFAWDKGYVVVVVVIIIVCTHLFDLEGKDATILLKGFVAK